MILLCLVSTFMFAVQEIETEPDRAWRTPSEISSQVTLLADSHEAVTTTTIGYSGDGLPIQCMQIAREGDVPIDARSAILLVAGIDGDHLLGTEVAIDIVTSVLAMDAESSKPLLETHKLYVIPQVNPDAASFYFNPIQNAQRRNLTPSDNDHDGMKDEDGVEDLNGDGLITMMRVPDLEKATHLIDPDEPRLNITPKPLEGKVASFVLYSEGIDNDGDGDYNEDGLGGVDLNKNFMHGYQFHGDGAGHWQLSESESKALAEFVLSHQEIASIIVYGQHDTLSKPFVENGKDMAGAPKKLAEEDVELYKIISEKFVELTALKDVEQPNWDGSFVAWSYAQYGVPAFSTPLWSRPEPVKEEQPDTDDANEENNPQNEEGELSPTSMRGNFDRKAMMEKFDADGDGELSDSEREKFRDSMQGSFDGRKGGGQRGQRGGSRRGGPSHGEEASADDSSSDSHLTPSGIGDVSQETLDELLAAAKASGYPVTDEMMEGLTPEDIEQYAKMSGIKIRRIKSNKGDNASPRGDVAWLTYSDNSRNGQGFIPWESFEHPQLGQVEIGGWTPYFKILPPTDAIEAITEKQAKFVIDIASRLPKVRISAPIVKKLSNGLWEVKVAVINDGWFPTGTAMAKKNKRARPFVVRLDVPNESIVSGRKVNLIWALDGKGTRKWYKWILQGKPNEKVDLTLYSEKFGTKTITTTLVETKGDGA